VSFPLLDEVAAVLTENMAIKIRIEGHTDNKGKAKYNKKLSQRRAESVRKYLIKRGISADRMTSAGFGMERPIEDNSTEAGRAANRRVEIHITSQ
jgi:OmpA-OmpF porin, OOP family